MKYIKNFAIKDFEDFAKTQCEKYDLEELAIYDNFGYARFFKTKRGAKAEFRFDDFNFYGINKSFSNDYSEDWRKFVKSKLNKENKVAYVEEFNEMLDSEKLSI